VRKKSREEERGKELAIKKEEKKEKGRLKSPTPCLTWLSEIP
jgi:hypothetical protein